MSVVTLTQALKGKGIQPDSIHFGLEKSPVLFYGDTEVWLGSIKLLTQKIAYLTADNVFPNIKGIPGIVHMENWSEENDSFIFEKKPEVSEEDTEGDIEDDAEGGMEEGLPPEDGSQDGSEGSSQEGEQPQDSESVEQNDPETPQDDEEQGENQDEDVSN